MYWHCNDRSLGNISCQSEKSDFQVATFQELSNGIAEHKALREGSGEGARGLAMGLWPPDGESAREPPMMTSGIGGEYKWTRLGCQSGLNCKIAIQTGKSVRYIL